jgi:hypothetical protein
MLAKETAVRDKLRDIFNMKEYTIVRTNLKGATHAFNVAFYSLYHHR